MSERKAFTLVELLVVIAIIALLIAILAPSLKAAKDLAKAAYCKTTLSALTKSSLVYADMNKGYLMVFEHSNVLDTAFIQGPTQPDRSATAFKSDGGRNPQTGLLTPMMYGLVYVAGILGPAEMFYCPAPINDQRHMLHAYPRPWGSATATGISQNSQFVRTSYMWNPWVNNVGTEDKHVTFDDALLVDRHPNERFLTSDLIASPEMMAHTTANSCKWNHGFPDGHVDEREYPWIYKAFKSGWGDDTARQWWRDWNYYIRPIVLGERTTPP